MGVQEEEEEVAGALLAGGGRRREGGAWLAGEGRRLAGGEEGEVAGALLAGGRRREEAAASIAARRSPTPAILPLPISLRQFFLGGSTFRVNKKYFACEHTPLKYLSDFPGRKLIFVEKKLLFRFLV